MKPSMLKRNLSLMALCMLSLFLPFTLLAGPIISDHTAVSTIASAQTFLFEQPTDTVKRYGPIDTKIPQNFPPLQDIINKPARVVPLAGLFT
jgi:hypothetical protein